MLQFQGVEVLLQLPHMNEVRRKLRVVATAVPQTCLMINWDLEVSLHQDLLNPESQGCHQAKDQSFILCHVVGGLELKVHHVLQLISVWVDEDHTSPGPLLAGGPIKEECPVRFGEDWCPDFRLRGSNIYGRTPRFAWGRSPLRYEISQDLALDRMARLEVQLELSQLCCPLGDIARGVGIVQDRS